MKKQLIIIGIMSFSFTTLLNAQDGDSENSFDQREKMTIGVKAGINYSNVWDEKGQDFRADAKVGLAGGAFLGIPIGKYLGFQPEVLISQKGFEASGTLLGFPYSFSKTKTYLDIPLQLQFKPISILTILGGPQFSYLLHEKNVYTFGTNSSEQELEFENDNIRKNVLGFVFGADINISHLVLSGRAGWDFQSNNGDGTSSTPRYKNQWVQLTVGFKL